MKAVSSDFNDSLQSDVSTLCQLFEMTRRDGVVYRRSTATRPKLFNTHIFLPGGFDPTDITSSSGEGIADLELVAYFNNELTESDVRSGRLDDANANITWGDWLHPINGTMKMFSGVVSGITITDDRTAVRFALSGILSTLTGIIGEIRSATCRAIFGDERCKVDIEALKISATAVSIVGTTLVVHSVVPPLKLTTSHAYWRINFGAALADGIKTPSSALSKVEFHATVGSADLAVGGTPIAGSNVATAPNAFDALPATAWSLLPNGIGLWIGYHFAAPVNVQEVSFTVQSAVPSSRSGTVEHSNDGIVWTAAPGFNFVGLRLTPGVKTLSIVDSPVSTDNAFSFGSVYFVDGANIGDSISIVEFVYNAITGNSTIVLMIQPTFAVAVGDHIDLYPGCDKTLKRCQFYNNVVNMRAEPYTPTANFQGQNRLLE